VRADWLNFWSAESLKRRRHRILRRIPERVFGTSMWIGILLNNNEHFVLVVAPSRGGGAAPPPPPPPGSRLAESVEPATSIKRQA
jgi:hypothetical protein